MHFQGVGHLTGWNASVGRHQWEACLMPSPWALRLNWHAMAHLSLLTHPFHCASFWPSISIPPLPPTVSNIRLDRWSCLSTSYRQHHEVLTMALQACRKVSLLLVPVPVPLSSCILGISAFSYFCKATTPFPTFWSLPAQSSFFSIPCSLMTQLKYHLHKPVLNSPSHFSSESLKIPALPMVPIAVSAWQSSPTTWLGCWQ